MKSLTTVLILIICVVLFTGCVKDNLDAVGVSIVEDEQTVMKLSLKSSSSRAEASVDNEETFVNVRVLIFNSDSQLVTNYAKKFTVPESAPAISVTTKSGKNRALYIVANANSALDKRLAMVKTRSELDVMQTNMGEFSNEIANKPLLMTAHRVVNITQGAYNLTEADGTPLKMHFAVAKIDLKLTDATPVSHSLNMIGWGFNSGAINTYLFPATDINGNPVDANTGMENNDAAWMDIDSDRRFDKEETDPVTGKKTVLINRFLFENRRGGRNVNQTIMPPYEIKPSIPGHINDKNSKGKAWYAPDRATYVTLAVLYKTESKTSLLKIKIFVGTDNHSDYNVVRGNHYDIQVTIKGINNIDVDTNMESQSGSFVVQTSTDLDKLDAHPGFRLVAINAENANVAIEVLDEAGRSYNEPGFSAGWLKISPVNFAYHQIKQEGTAGEWQQAAPTGYFVRPKYIPHHSVREMLTQKGIDGWNPVPVGLENDDEMNFQDATYRMCYKINNIWFQQGVVTAKSFGIYPDEFLNDEGTRVAKIKITHNGMDERIYTIIQHGYTTLFESGGGLSDLDKDGLLKTTTSKFVIEQFEEVGMQMNPGVGSDLQRVKHMQWGYSGKVLYTSPDKFRNGFFVTANAVYNDVKRVDDKPTNFGLSATSFREKYNGFNSNNKNPAIDGLPIPEPTTLGHGGPPYYLPTSVGNYYHPIYRSSAARYCHEKNRDMNGDGVIDESETEWYLPSQEELQLIWVCGKANFESLSYWSSTENDNMTSWYMDFDTGETSCGSTYNGILYFGKTQEMSVRCVRRIN